MAKKLSHQSDEELLLSLARGENEALDLLFLRHSNKVLGFALKKGLSRERAQDVVQIVFMQMYRKKDQYRPEHSAMAWLYVITRSETKDYRLREIKNFSELNEDLSQLEGDVPKLEQEESSRKQTQEMLSSLSPRERQVMEERYLHELEYAEIAKKLDQSESNIRQIVSRSVRLLRKKFSGGDL